MNFSDGCRPARLRSISAITVAVCVLVGVIGCGLVRFELAASAPPPPVGVSLGADNSECGDLDHDSSPTTHKAFSTAALPHVLPPRLRSVPVWRWSPSPVSLPALWYRLDGDCPRAPASVLAGQQLLTQLCIARC